MTLWPGQINLTLFHMVWSPADKGVAAEGDAGGADGCVRGQLRLHHGLGVPDGRPRPHQGIHTTCHRTTIRISATSRQASHALVAVAESSRAS